MFSKLLNTLLTLALALQFQGCASMAYGKSKQSNILKLHAGMSTEEVLSTIGDPQSVEFSTGKTVWNYKILMSEGSLSEQCSWYYLVFDSGKLSSVNVNVAANQEASRQWELNQQRMQQASENMMRSAESLNRVMNRTPANTLDFGQVQFCRVNSYGTVAACYNNLGLCQSGLSVGYVCIGR